MHSLGLAPLPASRLKGDVSVPESAGWEDFVTDEAVFGVLSGGSGRVGVERSYLELSASEDDFAGISVVPSSRVNATVSRVSSPLATGSPTVFEPVTGQQIEVPIWPDVAPETMEMSAISLGQRLRAGRATPPVVPGWESASGPARRGFRWRAPGWVGLVAFFLLAAVILWVTR